MMRCTVESRWLSRLSAATNQASLQYRSIVTIQSQDLGLWVQVGIKVEMLGNQSSCGVDVLNDQITAIY